MTTFSAGTLGRRSGKDNTKTTGGIAPKAILMVWRHVRSNGHYHYVEAILVLDWMAPASSWQRRQGRWGTCQDCEKRWTLRGRLPRRRGWDLNRTWCHPNIRCIFQKIQICVLTSGLHKLWYPSIQDTSMWTKFRAHGEHGDALLFSNLGALWFSENRSHPDRLSHLGLRNIWYVFCWLQTR